MDWHKTDKKFETCPPHEDPGVIACAEMYGYFKKYGHETICMPASWRPSRGKGYDLDEILELAGTDRMTIPPNFLTQLANSQEKVVRKLEPKAAAAACTAPQLGGGRVEEKEFRFLLNQVDSTECKPNTTSVLTRVLLKHYERLNLTVINFSLTQTLLAS